MPSGVYIRTETAKKNISVAAKGRIPWNKGLTKETDNRIMLMSEKISTIRSKKFHKINKDKKDIKRSSWIKDLTKETDERVRKLEENVSKSLKEHFKIHFQANKNKTYEEFYGEEKAKQLRENRRISSRKRRLDELVKNKSQLSIGKNEIKLLGEQEKIDNCKIIRQYIIPGLHYIVDGYCQETNTVYEVYEKFHLKESAINYDINRQNEIEKQLKCKFVIILDK